VFCREYVGFTIRLAPLGPRVIFFVDGIVLVLVGFGWFWLVLVGFGWFWLVLVGFGWFWLVLVCYELRY